MLVPVLLIWVMECRLILGPFSWSSWRFSLQLPCLSSTTSSLMPFIQFQDKKCSEIPEICISLSRFLGPSLSEDLYLNTGFIFIFSFSPCSPLFLFPHIFYKGLFDFSLSWHVTIKEWMFSPACVHLLAPLHWKTEAHVLVKRQVA